MSWLRACGYKTFFMLNSAKHEIPPVKKKENKKQEDHCGPVLLTWGHRVFIWTEDTDAKYFQSSELVANKDSVSLFPEKAF